MNKYSILRKMVIIVTIIIILTLIVVAVFENNIKQLVFDMARSQVRAIATNTFNEAVAEIFEDNVSYNDLINIVLDNNGKVTMINADTVKMNRLATQTAMLAQSKISQIGESGVKIPIGSLFKSNFLAGRGPKITVKIIPIGSVSTQFVTEFEQAGINQTRHKILLLATIKVNIVIPTGGDIVTVNSYVPISESIIIGEVPESFVMVNDENMLNLIP